MKKGYIVKLRRNIGPLNIKDEYKIDKVINNNLVLIGTGGGVFTQVNIMDLILIKKISDREIIERELNELNKEIIEIDNKIRILKKYNLKEIDDKTLKSLKILELIKEEKNEKNLLNEIKKII